MIAVGEGAHLTGKMVGLYIENSFVLKYPPRLSQKREESQCSVPDALYRVVTFKLRSGLHLIV